MYFTTRSGRAALRRAISTLAGTMRLRKLCAMLTIATEANMIRLHKPLAVDMLQPP